MCSFGSNWQFVNVSSGNDLVLNRTNNEPIFTQINVTIWRHQASLSYHHLAKKELKKLCDDAIAVRFLLAYYWWHVSHKHWVGNYCSPHMTCKHHNWNRTLLENELGMSNWVNSRCVTYYDIEAEQHIYASVNYPPLVQIIARRLAGAKLLSEPMLGYCELDPWEQTSVKS